MINLGMSQATEGLDVDALRESMLSEVYRQRPQTQTGISQGQALAVDTMQDIGRSQAQAMGDVQIGLADDEVKRQGEVTLAQGLTNRAQLLAQRDAGIAESRMQVEAEAGRRKGAFLGSVMNLASAAIDPSKIRLFKGGRVPDAPERPTTPNIRPNLTGPNSVHTYQGLMYANQQLEDQIF